MSFQNNANAETFYKICRSTHMLSLKESAVMKIKYTIAPGSSSPWIVTADIRHGQIQASQKRQFNKLMAPSQADKSRMSWSDSMLKFA